MCPPLDVPSAPSRSSTDSTEMPRSRIAPFNAAVLAPGSPDASPGSGNGSPSVCSTSYLGTSQPGHGNARGGGRGRHFHPKGRERGRHFHPKGRVEEYALQWSAQSVQRVLDTAFAWSVMNSHLDVADFL